MKPEVGQYIEVDLGCIRSSDADRIVAGHSTLVGMEHQKFCDSRVVVKVTEVISINERVASRFSVLAKCVKSDYPSLIGETAHYSIWYSDNPMLVSELEALVFECDA